MDGGAAGLHTLTRREQSALRSVLVRATARACRSDDSGVLDRLVADAPMHALPAAASLHRVAGSVERGLEGVDGVPDAVRDQLRALRGYDTFHHLLMTGALAEIGRAFDDAGLRWLAMKGPVVAALLYPDVGDRSYADLDLLVDRRDFPQAMQILERTGFEHAVHDWALAEAMLAGQVSMRRQAVSIDLHWHLHYSEQDRRPFALQPEAMLERHRVVAVSGVRAPTFDPVDTLLTLAFHAARSDGHRLVWLKDIERSLAVDAPDLDELVRRCDAYRCAPPVGLILGRARSMLDAEVPEEVVHRLTPLPLRAADRTVVALSDPVRLHERGTAARAFTRSVRSSATSTVRAVPGRVVRDLRRRFFPPGLNETDCPEEKQRYLQAVSSSTAS